MIPIIIRRQSDIIILDKKNVRLVSSLGCYNLYIQIKKCQKRIKKEKKRKRNNNKKLQRNIHIQRKR